MRKLELSSPAKINLYLRVLNKRPDGYRNIQTLFERINLCDKIILKIIPENRIELHCDHPDVPQDETNLAFIAARLLRNDFPSSFGVRIDVKKRIPVASGLGGGSSNAAGVLLGLNRLCRLKLTKKILMRYAQKIGADVSFFIADSPFALGSERGDKIIPLKVKRQFWHVVAVANIKVPTERVYKAFRPAREREDLRLTKTLFNIKIINYILRKAKVSALRPLVYNDLEAIVIKRHKYLLKILKEIDKCGAISGMSGSGAAVFGICNSKNHAERIKKRLNRFRDLQSFVCRTS